MLTQRFLNNWAVLSVTVNTPKFCIYMPLAALIPNRKTIAVVIKKKTPQAKAMRLLDTNLCVCDGNGQKCVYFPKNLDIHGIAGIAGIAGKSNSFYFCPKTDCIIVIK